MGREQDDEMICLSSYTGGVLKLQPSPVPTPAVYLSFKDDEMTQTNHHLEAGEYAGVFKL